MAHDKRGAFKENGLRLYAGEWTGENKVKMMAWTYSFDYQKLGIAKFSFELQMNSLKFPVLLTRSPRGIRRHEGDVFFLYGLVYSTENMFISLESAEIICSDDSYQLV